MERKVECRSPWLIYKRMLDREVLKVRKENDSRGVRDTNQKLKDLELEERKK